MQKETIFYKKNFLIYGFGKSGYASYKFLNKKNNCKIFDDKKKNIPLKYNHDIVNYNQLKKINFDYIVLSPGIDMRNCSLSAYLKANTTKIITELDIFYLSYPNIKKITITGTNGKSTTSKLLYDVLKEHGKDVRLTGNIGSPILLQTKLNNNTLFVIEASSYQLEYSKFFKSEYSIILNLSPDHLERHGNFKNYVKAKFKLIQNQSKKHYAFIEKKNFLLNNLIKKNKTKSKIYKVNYEKYQKYYKFVLNDYFRSIPNLKNLSFVFAISKNLKLSLKKIINVANKFKQLDFRQQIIYQSRKLIIINDSKSTSLSSTLPLLESFRNIYWILGGMAKKGDQLNLKKENFKNINAFIYGKDKLFFSKVLSNKIKYKLSKNLNHSLIKAFKDLKKKEEKKKILLFSPSAASFDQFKNFEDRGRYFNKIIKKYLKK
tara:strand:- start:587 stop:1882 length:1296 start_codon:yes stop_codon:yes gene_type:complete